MSDRPAMSAGDVRPQPEDRPAICGICINSQRRILLVRKQQTWILPGGKPEEGETDEECLRRECSEELPELTISNPRFFAEVEGVTPHSRRPIVVRTYLIDATGPITVAAEIEAATWSSDPLGYLLSQPSRQIVRALRAQGYLY